jgi:hypothetical protein
MMCEESERHVNVGLLHPLLCFARARCFAFSAMILQGYKSEQMPLCTLTSCCTISYFLLKFFLASKRERERRKRDFWGFRECCFSFPLDP